jgi:hypothetical protein
VSRAAAVFWDVFAPVLIVLVLAGMALAIALAVPGCGSAPHRVEQPIVEAAAVSGDAAVRLVGDAERREGLRVIEASGSLAEAREGLEALEARWSVAWAALDALAVAQDIAAEALEAGEPPDLVALGRAFCSALEVLGALDVELPGVPAMGCAK